MSRTTRRACVAAALSLTLAVSGACAADPAAPPSEPPVTTTSPAAQHPSTSQRARHILQRWDRRRAAAWADGAPAALGRLYVPGSLAGRRDVAMLRRWRGRGLTVQGLQMQVVRVQVLTASSRRLVLVVDDRVAWAVARRGAGAPVPLPRDGIDRHRLVLRRTRGRWRMAAVGWPVVRSVNRPKSVDPGKARDRSPAQSSAAMSRRDPGTGSPTR